MRKRAVLDVGRRVHLSVLPSVRHTQTLYCIKTAKDITRLFSRPGIPIILVSFRPSGVTKGKTPSSAGVSYLWVFLLTSSKEGVLPGDCLFVCNRLLIGCYSNYTIDVSLDKT